MSRFVSTLGLLTLGTVALTGCDLLQNNTQYLATVASEVVFVNIPGEALREVGVNAPDTVAITVALGRLTTPENITSSPFTGEGVKDAVVKLQLPDGTSLDLKSDENAAGFYYLTNLDDERLTYQEGADYKVTLSFGEQDFWIKVNPTGGANLTEPAELGQYHEPGTPLTLKWEPASDNALVAVFDSDGQQVYDNLPKDLNSIYNFLTQEEVSTLEIPGSVFGSSYAYGVALVGMERKPADTSTFSTNLNHLASNTVTGTAVVTAVTTVEIPDLPQ